MGDVLEHIELEYSKNYYLNLLRIINVDISLFLFPLNTNKVKPMEIHMKSIYSQMLTRIYGRTFSIPPIN